MIADGEDHLYCDLAETYGVLDPRALGAVRLSALASGLGEASRIRRKRSGAAAGLDTLLLAQIADAVRLIVWQLSGAKSDPPESFVQKLYDSPAENPHKNDSDICAFDTAEEFEAAWRLATGQK